MPFSRRPTSFNEEVLAGLAIFLLIALAVGVWWYYQGAALFRTEEEAPITITELQGEERQEMIREAAAELEADAKLRGGPTPEERAEIAREEVSVTGHEPTLEASIDWVLSQ